MSLNDGRVTVVLFFAICAVVLGNTLISGGRDKNRAIAPSSLDYTQPLPVRSAVTSDPVGLAGEPSYANASLTILPINQHINGRQIARRLAQQRGTGHVVSLGSRGVGIYSMSAPSVAGDHRLVNDYLEGFQPYAVDNPMIPLYALAQRKQYQLDAQQYAGREEVWQTSREAFAFARGDCEDHALILADWLIAMGEDARVVLGDYRGGGHAWVVLFKDGREYLLEATKKTGLTRSKPYPLASLHRDYHPQVMFNRYDFWQNQGSKFTTRYSGGEWHKQSHYQPTL
ncbi:MAG: transglutaminase domain-containing protein [Porticoccaceae bacterium]|nr:transglutaminase domain-containing protein [Porticoccaceae bacterium]